MDKNTLFQESLNREAQRLARQFSIDYQKLQNILARLPYYPNKDYTDFSFVLFTMRRPNEILLPEEILQSKPQDKGLAFMEVFGGFQYLFIKEQLPFHTLDELEAIISQFIPYLGNNAESLIKTGYPNDYFRPSVWLDGHLSKLYCTKFFALTKRGKNPQGESILEYVWAKPSWPFKAHPEFFNYFPPDLSEVNIAAAFDNDTGCSYEEAILLEGMSQEDAERIATMREKLLKLKLDILIEFKQALQTRNADNLWQTSLDLIRNTLTFDEVDFLIQMDVFYRNFNKRTNDRPVFSNFLFLKSFGGGLTDLLWMIGHIEEELTIGAYHKTREAMDSLVNLDKITGYPVPNITMENLLSPEFDIDRTKEETIKRTFEISDTYEASKQAFWDNFIQRVNNTLQTELYTNPGSGQKTSRSLSSKFEPTIKPYTEFLTATAQG